MTDRINEVAEKIKVAIYFGEHSNVLLLLTALVTETEERVRKEVGSPGIHPQIPTVTNRPDGSDQVHLEDREM